MKILHLNSYFIRSGLYKNLYDLQVKTGNEINVFVPVLKNYEQPDYEMGDYSDIVPDFSQLDRYFFHIKNFKMYKDVKARYSIDSYDLVHAHTLFTNGYMAYKMNKDYGSDYIVAIRDTDVNVFFRKQFWLRLLGNKILQNSKAIIFLSESYKENVIKKYINKKYKQEVLRKSIVIPNGINKYWIENRALEPKVYDNTRKEINIICVGTVYKRKNIETVVKVAKELQKIGYKIKLQVIGAVRDQKIYNKLIAESIVQYYPKQPKEELIKFYRNSDILILPSVTETFGLVYAEAISQGVPVIYTRNQGFDRQFEDGEVGFAVDCFDVKEIVEKTIKVLANYEIISSNCIKGCQKFDWAVINSEYQKIYNELVNSRKS